MFKGDIRLIYTKNSFERFLNEEILPSIIENIDFKYEEILKKYVDKNLFGRYIRKYHKKLFDDEYEIWIKEKQNANTEI